MGTPSPTSAEQFDTEYPEELADRLAWLERRLRVSRGRILRLMGVSDADGQSWKQIAQAHEAQAERAEHLLTHYLSYFDYDTEKAGNFVRDFEQKVEQGDIRLSDYVPGLATAATPEAEEEALLWSLRDEGPSFLPALARLLADRPATADRTTPHRGARVFRQGRSHHR
jgi:hypothetical protein